ncbi:hemagglutinin repeat-containing protein [Iodobacter fluviatilis]|uniref:hemagglutinin repeat-containing protein n=1 Tax=Iodobacter fluviatilis TaxID=537 RepID=UPI001559C9EA|nr:hemagglutinin repeat-containing protein [Iodobacter fluviatilis]
MAEQPMECRKTFTLISGGGTNLRGATVTGQQEVIADIKGNLNVESLQDISQFDNKQIGGSASVMIGYGSASASGSASGSYDKTHNDYAAVSEQSGIFAGKDGFDIKVKNNTDLTGAVIVSSSDSNKLSTGTLTQKDISNHAETDAISLGGGLDFSSSGKEQTSQTKGADQSNVSASAPSVMGAQESDSSSTKSAISKGQITLTDDAKQKELTGQTAAETIASLNHDTDGAQQKLANHFD